jgi:NAD(P)-dependent dehydrogenase (short-subunit alcohol dehydrogenase family)
MPASSDTSSPVAIITGAGSGIGRALALLLGGRGYDLVLVSRGRAALEDLCGELARRSPAARTLVHAGDVGDEHAAGAIVAATLDRFGRLDALVNNAGRAPLTPIGATTPALLAEVYAVNALGPARLIAAAWAVFERQHRAGSSHRLGARVVNVSTMGTLDPFPGFFAYASAKASVNVMAKSVAIEGASIGVRGFAVAPGAVETPMLRGLFGPGAIPPEACLSAEAVAAEIAACLAGERDEYNGKTIVLKQGEPARVV